MLYRDFEVPSFEDNGIKKTNCIQCTRAGLINTFSFSRFGADSGFKLRFF
jgi:hypothetical protein